jgi:hypothetical protein
VITGSLESGIVDEIIFAPTGEREDKTYGIQTHFRERMMEVFYQELFNE